MKGTIMILGYIIVAINAMLIGIVMGIVVHSNRTKYQAKELKRIHSDELRIQRAEHYRSGWAAATKYFEQDLENAQLHHGTDSTDN